MNYIKHLTGFFDKVVNDHTLNPTHISLYIALFQFWNCNRFRNPISISRIKKTLTLSNVNKVFATETAFSALKNDKTIVAWGNNGGNYTEAVQTYENLTNKSDYNIDDYVKISNSGIFLVTKNGGFWTSNYDNYFGPDNSTHGLKNHKISDIMSGIKKILVNYEAICLLKDDNSVITWGNSESGKFYSYGGNSSNLQSFLSSNIKDIIKTERAFCALNYDGKIMTWGNSNYGGDSTATILWRQFYDDD